MPPSDNLGGTSKKNDECVKVVVRIRPLSNDERSQQKYVVATVDESRGEICVRNPSGGKDEAPKSFFFDSVFGDGVTQRRVYEVCGAPLVESVLEGYNGTIFAYGQTGAGKTHTMEGIADVAEQRGIIPNSFQHIFDKIALADNVQYLVRASYLEIYNEEIYDLLAKQGNVNLELKENVDTGVYVKDLTKYMVKSSMEIQNIMLEGKKRRHVAKTNMNDGSSRSHSIFTIVVECSDLHDKGGHIRMGKLNLVDLAGSERQAKTGAKGDRLKEATKINLSLSALGNVISALVDGRSQHIPYRDSKLTRLLQDSLGGNTKTVMCANCGPADYNYDETVSTLRYANRAKNIKNKPKINEDPKDAMLREFQEEIQRLKQQLEQQQSMGEHTIYVDGKAVQLPAGMAPENFRVQSEGASEEELKKLQGEAEKRERELRQQAAEDMKTLLDENTRTAEEREALRLRLEKEVEERRRIEKGKQSLKKRIQGLQEKLLKGGEIMDKAARQEAELRQAQHDLELRKVQEDLIARELRDKVEDLDSMDMKYKDLQEEVMVKTRKLEKLFGRFQAAQREVEDIQIEFEAERQDMLETIRGMERELKKRDLIISNFIPVLDLKKVEERCVWSDTEDTYVIPRMDLTGNCIRAQVARPVSEEGLLRPETEYARQRKQYDPSPRYKYDNILRQDIDLPERTTQVYEGPGMTSRVASAMAVPLDAAEDEVSFTPADSAAGQPYLKYNEGADEADGDDNGDTRQEKQKDTGRSSKKSSSSSRPKSAGRRKRSGGDADPAPEFKQDDEVYPSARGLVRK